MLDLCEGCVYFPSLYLPSLFLRRVAIDFPSVDVEVICLEFLKSLLKAFVKTVATFLVWGSFKGFSDLAFLFLRVPLGMMSSYHLVPSSGYCSFFFSLRNYWHLELRQIFHVLTIKMWLFCSSPPPPKCSYKIRLIFLLWLHFFLSLSVVASSSIVSAGTLIYFLLLLCLKIYDVFIAYCASVPVIWLLLYTYLNSEKILQLSSWELLFVEISVFDSFLIYNRSS